MNAVAIFETQRGALAQWTVINRKWRLCLRKMLQGYVFVAIMLVMQHSMAVTERASLTILSTQSNRRAISKNRGKSQRLRLSPIYSSLRPHCASATLQQARQFGMG